tara:strand:+ start:344 stop:583 length:240 start_codon:yes stop_codon:yes gene_type:complete
MSEEDYIGFALHQEQLLERQRLELKKNCTIRKLQQSSLESRFNYGLLYSTEFAEERRWYTTEEKRDEEFKKLMQERDNE